MNRLILAIAAAFFSLAVNAADPAPETVLVKRGDTTVTAADFYAYMGQVPEQERAFFRGDVDRIKNAASSMYLNRSLAEKAREQGIDKDPEVQRRFQLAQESILASLYLERFQKAIKYPDFTAVAMEKYKATPERYQKPERVRLRELLVGLEGRSEEEARKRVEEVRARLVGGEAFNGAIIREYSNDPKTRYADGLTEGPYAALAPEVAAIARTIPLDQLSEPIKGKDGYWLIRVSERVPERVVPFEAVKEGLIAAEERKFRATTVDRMLGSITNSKDVVIYTDELAALKVEVDRQKLDEMHNEKALRDAEAKKRLIEEAAKRPAN